MGLKSAVIWYVMGFPIMAVMFLGLLILGALLFGAVMVISNAELVEPAELVAVMVAL